MLSQTRIDMFVMDADLGTLCAPVLAPFALARCTFVQLQLQSCTLILIIVSSGHLIRVCTLDVTLWLQVADLEKQLAEVREERKMYTDKLELLKDKHKKKRQAWADERLRLVRTIDTQTATNAAQQNVRLRSLIREAPSSCAESNSPS